MPGDLDRSVFRKGNGVRFGYPEGQGREGRVRGQREGEKMGGQRLGERFDGLVGCWFDELESVKS